MMFQIVELEVRVAPLRRGVEQIIMAIVLVRLAQAVIQEHQ